jgi:hypothetical protein
MLSFTRLSAKARIAAATGVTLLATGAAAVPAAYAGTAPQPTVSVVVGTVVSQGAAAASSCTANILGPTADHNHERIDQWWYTHGTHIGCVGTVYTTTYVAAGGHCVNPQLRVYGGGVLKVKGYVYYPGTHTKRFFCPSQYRSVKVLWPVHTVVPFAIKLRATAEFQGGGGILGPAEVTVRH